MTPKSPLIPIVLSACALMTGACANSRPISAEPPRLILPELAMRPCRLPVLPDEATQADLEAVYMQRGAALAECEAARRLAVSAATALMRPVSP